MMQVEVLLYEGCDELDAIGPYEVMAGVGAATGRFDVRLVTHGGVETVTGSHGVRIEAHAPLSAAPDLLIVPGGGWNDRRPAGAGPRSRTARCRARSQRPTPPDRLSRPSAPARCWLRPRGC
jgi:putative intracellular protease/amidase